MRRRRRISQNNGPCGVIYASSPIFGRWYQSVFLIEIPVVSFRSKRPCRGSLISGSPIIAALPFDYCTSLVRVRRFPIHHANLKVIPIPSRPWVVAYVAYRTRNAEYRDLNYPTFTI